MYPRWLRSGLRLIAYVLVEAAAESCHRRFAATLRPYTGWADVVAGATTMSWAFEVHTRFAFRFWRLDVSWFEGVLRYLAATWLVLASVAAWTRFAGETSIPLWGCLTLLKGAWLLRVFEREPYRCAE